MHDKGFMNELYTPYKDPEREFRSSRRYFKSLSLDELRSPDFNLLFDEEYSEEEEEEAMETMEQYMSKTQTTFLEIVDLFHVPNNTVDQLMLQVFPISLTGAASRWLRGDFVLQWFGCPTRQILDSRGAVPTKTDADAKTVIQEMAEYSQKWHNGTSRGRSTKTSDGLTAIQAQLNNLGREIKKVNEKVYATQVGCEQCNGPYYPKDCPQKEEGKALEEAYYTQFGGPFQGGGYRATTPGYYQRNNANPSFQERRQSMEDTMSKFMSESAKRHEENSNLIKEIRASTDAAIRNQGASIKTLEIQIRQMSKVLRERGFGSYRKLNLKTNPRPKSCRFQHTIKAVSNIIYPYWI
ncbi:hypothetical protein Tco_1457447 [Tanacetum coccineum]